MNWIYITAGLTYVLGFITSYVNRLTGFCLMTVRIPPDKAFKIYSAITKEASYKLVLNDCLPASTDYTVPETEQSIIKLNGVWCYSDISEKYLTAGTSGKEIIYTLSYLRPQRKRLLDYLRALCVFQPVDREFINIYSTNGNWFQQISQLCRAKVSFPNIQKDAEEKIIGLVDQFHDGRKASAGILLHGPPGNGKTSIIRGLAALLDYDIFIPIIKATSTNEDIIRMFMYMPKRKCIILFEDFDNLFDRRYPKLANAQHSFDVILNILDGLYADLTDRLIFITTNKLGDVDDAIKNRPSRMDLSIEIGNPDYSTRLELLGEADKALATEGMSYSTVQELVRRDTPLEEIPHEGRKLEVDIMGQLAQAISSPPKYKAFAKYKKGITINL